MTRHDRSGDSAPLQLVLMRHAKSDWAEEGVADFDRPLADRGRRDAPRIGRWLADRSLVPQRVLCSAAARTRETARLVMQPWAAEVELLVERQLYLAHAEEILRTIRCTEREIRRLMVIGHNPGIGVLVSQLGGRVVPKFPTAAVAVFAIEAPAWGDPWKNIALADQIVPKALAG